jgi:hypothetical protein
MVRKIKKPLKARACDGCTECCIVFAVDELLKPARQRCQHVVDHTGCTRYETRPDACRKFACLWAQGVIPKWARPDKAGIIFDVTRSNSAMQIHTGLQAMVVRECHTDALKRADVRTLLDAISAIHLLYILDGEQRTMRGPAEKMARIAAFVQRRMLS